MSTFIKFRVNTRASLGGQRLRFADNYRLAASLNDTADEILLRCGTASFAWKEIPDPKYSKNLGHAIFDRKREVFLEDADGTYVDELPQCQAEYFLPQSGRATGRMLMDSDSIVAFVLSDLGDIVLCPPFFSEEKVSLQSYKDGRLPLQVLTVSGYILQDPTRIAHLSILETVKESLSGAWLLHEIFHLSVFNQGLHNDKHGGSKSPNSPRSWRTA